MPWPNISLSIPGSYELYYIVWEWLLPVSARQDDGRGRQETQQSLSPRLRASTRQDLQPNLPCDHRAAHTAATPHFLADSSLLTWLLAKRLAFLPRSLQPTLDWASVNWECSNVIRQPPLRLQYCLTVGYSLFCDPASELISELQKLGIMCKCLLSGLIQSSHRGSRFIEMHNCAACNSKLSWDYSLVNPTLLLCPWS